MKTADHTIDHFCTEHLTAVTTPLKSGDQEKMQQVPQYQVIPAEKFKSHWCILDGSFKMKMER
jgi:hypothetical protein